MGQTMTKLRAVLTAVLCALVLFGLAVGLWLFPSYDTVRTERRKPAALPNAQALLSDDFSSAFESFLLDRFPGRIQFRQAKAAAQFGLFRQLDNNGIYIADGSVSRFAGSYNAAAVTRTAEKLSYVAQNLPEGCRTYFAMIPDKNYYLAEANGYPCYDYAQMRALLHGSLPEQMQTIDLFPSLSAGDYYRTDTHWDQSRLADTVATLEAAMELPHTVQDYTETRLPGFYGVYYGQAALPMAPDTLTYLTSPLLERATAQILDEKTLEFREVPVYDEANFQNIDPYDLFLSGAQPVVRLQNPDGGARRRLILFRDSYGSSLAPLLLQHYDEIVLVDFRYLNYQYLSRFVEIEPGDDVLFLYSSLLLSGSDTLQIFPK